MIDPQFIPRACIPILALCSWGCNSATVEPAEPHAAGSSSMPMAGAPAAISGGRMASVAANGGGAAGVMMAAGAGASGGSAGKLATAAAADGGGAGARGVDTQAGSSASLPVAGAGGTPPRARAQENDLGSCTVAALPDAGALPTIAKLPDPFKQLDGTRISNKTDWHCRQAEIRAQAEKYVYGQKPAKPQSVSGSITNTKLSVEVMDNGKRTSFSAAVVLPGSGTAPYPVIIVYGGLGLGFAAPLDPDVIESEGIALIQYDVGVTGKEGTGRSNKQGAFYDITGSGSSTGLLTAWGWGVSRMIDVIEQSDGKLFKAEAVAVTGCSRFGKGAFAAGALDQRVALTMPIESGTGGVPILRGIAAEGAQSLSSAYGEQPWFGDAFSAFTGDPTKLPIDTHEIIGLIAPRGLFIMDNPAIANLGPKAAHVSALAGAEIYKALGAADNISYYSAV